MPTKSASPITLKFDEEEVESLTKAVEFYNAYLVSQARSQEIYRRLAERLKMAG